MKALSYILFFVLSLQFVDAQTTTKFFPSLKKSNFQTSQVSGLITYVKFSNSINGPFISPATIQTKDSLFVTMDASPNGYLIAEYYIDINENGVIDENDFLIGEDSYSDNNSTHSNNYDLDPSLGTIISYLQVGSLPSMQIIAKVFEGVTSVEGIIMFINSPAQFTLSGTIYNLSDNNIIPGAWVMAIQSETSQVGDVADMYGNYSLPLESGEYYIWVDHPSGMFNSFVTMIVINENTVHDFYLAPLTSYIRGFVRDELSNPIPNVRLYRENSSGMGEVLTDQNGEYKMLVPPGFGRIGLSDETLLPNYLVPSSHEYEISDNDSIVNNRVSNFTCYTANSTITGTVTMAINKTSSQFIPIQGWSGELQSWTETLTNLSGQFALPVHSNIALQPKYGVSINTNHWQYPVPEGVYPDTSYWNLEPGSVANFNLLLADTSAVDPFVGNYTQPSQMWDIYQFNHDYSGVQCVGDRLKVQATSWGGESGVGVVTRKPFQLKSREFRIYIDHSELGSNNSVYFVLSGRRINWNHPSNENNTLVLTFSKQSVGGGWRLQQNYGWGIIDLWQSSDITGEHIMFQFDENASTLTLKIDGVIKYEGPWAELFSLAYVHLLQFNSNPNPPTPVYFDEFFVGAVGSTGVREIGGELPQDFKLEQNYPNPFNPLTNINFQLPRLSSVNLKVYNVLGQEVAELLNGEMNAGKYEVTFDASKLSSGIYYYRLTAVDTKTGQLLMNNSRKAILLK